MKFSLILITRNEAKTLPRFLDSVSVFMQDGGEVVVVDTGSTDATPEIARARGCVVHLADEQFKHTIDEVTAKSVNFAFVAEGEEPVVAEGDTYFDFATARNFAASLASNDMVSCIDADEVLVSFDYKAIDALIAKGADAFEYEFVYAHSDDGNPSVAFKQSKFYNRTKQKWVGIIHEVLDGTFDSKVFLDKKTFGLEHFQNPETNRTGYLRGLALDVYSNPDNDRNRHYFARELMYTKRYKSAILQFQAHIDMDKWDAERAQSWIYMGDCYGSLEDYMLQVSCYHQASHVCTTKRESFLRLAYFYKRLNKPQLVVAYTLAAMSIPWSGFYTDNRCDYEDVPHALLYWAYGWMGFIDKAQYHITEALKYQPTNATYLHDKKYYG